MHRGYRPAFASFVAPAQRRPQFWRLCLGLLLCLAVYIGAVVAGFRALGALPEGADPGALITPDRPAGALLLLASFVAMGAGPLLAAALFHLRGPLTLLGPPGRAVRHFVVSGGIVFGLFGASLAFWGVLYEAEPNLPWGMWLALLPLTLLGLLVQTGAEEVLFRGYLMQQLAARFRSRLVWMFLPAIAFGVTHYDPTAAGPGAWWPIAGAMLFGLIAADLTAATGSLGAAWGLHFANNAVALALVATDGTITGLARYVTPYDLASLPAGLVAGDAVLLVLAWLVCRRLLAR